MKFIKAYDIDVIRLKDGRHAFDFEVNNAFVEHFEAQDWLNGADLSVDVQVSKTVSVMEVDFHIHGQINLTCDRSLEEFDQPFDLREKVVYKYGPVEAEISEDVFMITKDTPSINIAQLIYEYILLAIPAKKIHPDYREEGDEEEDNFGEDLGHIVDFEKKYKKVLGEEDSAEGPIDPRWEILKQLKKKE